MAGDPSQEGGPKRALERPSAVVLDLTPRLPRRPAVIEPPPARSWPGWSHWVAASVLVLLGAALGLLASWTLDRLADLDARAVLARDLVPGEGLYLEWSLHPQLPLRLMGPEAVAARSPRHPPGLDTETLRRMELRLMRDDPEDPERLPLLGLLQLRARVPALWPETERVLRLQLERFPPSAIVLNNLSVALLLQEGQDEAAELLEQARTLSPQEPAILHNRAILARAELDNIVEHRLLSEYLLADPGASWRPVMEARYVQLSQRLSQNQAGSNQARSD